MRETRFSKGGFVRDFILNALSSGLPLLILQLHILPQIGKQLGVSAYGVVVTLISVISLIGSSLGNSLNNTRLIMDKTYREKSISGDFIFLTLVSSCFAAIISYIALLALRVNQTSSFAVFFIFIIVLTIVHDYALVQYRLSLNFTRLLINSVMLTLGYLVGYWLFTSSGIWLYTYFIGLVFSLIYLKFSGNLLSEPLRRTPLIKKTTTTFIQLATASLLMQSINYLDRLLLFPLLGSESVSIYYAATVVSKIILMVIAPLSGVILSYIVRIDHFSRKQIGKMIFFASIAGVLGYVFTVLVSRPVLFYLYPEWAELSLNILSYATIGAMISAVTMMLNPIVVRFIKTKWQVIIGATNLVVFIVAGYFLSNHYGLIGFAWSVIITNAIKLIMTIALCLLNPLKDEKLSTQTN